MDEIWQLQDSHAISADGVRQVVQNRLDRGERETWFESSSGRTAGFVANGARAMLVLMEFEGDAGFHAGDPAAGRMTSLATCWAMDKSIRIPTATRSPSTRRSRR